MTVPTSHGLPPSQAPLAEARAAEGTEPPVETASQRMSRGTRNLIEWIVVVVVAVVLALLVRSYVAQTFYIPSPSMEPTLDVGDRILVFKAAYDFTNPAIGDVIVFKAPLAEHLRCSDPGVQDLVKRIIATPGDSLYSVGNTIYIERAGQKKAGFVPLAQPWQHAQQIGQQIASKKYPENVPQGQYFVMGDNRPNSCDSRVWGTVPRGNIIGKAVFIFWPLSRVGTI